MLSRSPIELSWTAKNSWCHWNGSEFWIYVTAVRVLTAHCSGGNTCWRKNGPGPPAALDNNTKGVQSQNFPQQATSIFKFLKGWCRSSKQVAVVALLNLAQYFSIHSFTTCAGCNMRGSAVFVVFSRSELQRCPMSESLIFTQRTWVPIMKFEM